MSEGRRTFNGTSTEASDGVTKLCGKRAVKNVIKLPRAYGGCLGIESR